MPAGQVSSRCLGQTHTPLSWILLYSNQSVSAFLLIQMFGAVLAAAGTLGSGLIADRIGRRRTLGLLATLIAVFSGFAPTLLGGGTLGQDVFILIGFSLLGLSYGQAAGAMNASFEPKVRYTGAALASDLAWLIGAGFAPLVALGLSANFGLGYVSLYLLFGGRVHAGGAVGEPQARGTRRGLMPAADRAARLRAGAAAFTAPSGPAATSARRPRPTRTRPGARGRRRPAAARCRTVANRRWPTDGRRERRCGRVAR